MAGIGVWLRRLLGRGKDPGAGSSAPLEAPAPGGPAPLAEGNNAFAIAMYRALGPRSGNLLFSPFSIRTALAMVQVGAAARTAAQMSEVLRTSPVDSPADVDLAAGTQPPSGGGGGCELEVANSLWCQEGAPLRAGFTELIDRRFHGGVHLVDFRRAAEAARAAINQWVETNTRHKIRELIPSDTVIRDNRLVVVNAVYFKGFWAMQFSRAATRDEPFFLEGGGTVRAPLMHQQEEVQYLRGPGYQAVNLAYRGSGLSMLVLVPDRNNGLPELERRLSAGMLRDAAAHMDVCEVNLFLPRFTIAWGPVDMRSPLETIGMRLPFDPSQADFSGINGCQPPDEEALFVSAVLHKAFVEVNEKGTEAAAATAAEMAPGATPGHSRRRVIPVVRGDHPFLFAILHRLSGGIVFLGRVAKPTTENSP